jgi:dTDP-glucose pyrophosphorylase/CBS domain-containing protein
MLIKGKDLDSLLLRPNATLQDAIIKMNNTKFKIIFIIEKKKIFLGTLSDGDIRRALAEGAALGDQILQYYNKNSFTININNKKFNNIENIKKMFFEKNIFSIPMLDNNKIVGFYDIRDFLSQSLNRSLVLIMAGGFGKRLMPLTKKIPKPMLPIKGKPILQITLENLKLQNFKQILISTHYKSEIIKKYFKDGKKLELKINYLEEKKPLGTAGSLKLIKNFFIKQYENLLIVNGDILTDINFQNILDFHKSHQSDLTIAVKNINISNNFGVVKKEGILFTDIEEKPTTSYNVNAGIYILKTNIIKNIKFKRNINMVDVINQIKKIKKKVIVYPIHEDWTDIGTREIYEKYK